jgi:hypothetical protein
MDILKTGAETALSAPWSLEAYDRWLREQEERDAAERDQANLKVIARFDPECEAAVRALEEANFGRQISFDGRR